MRSSLPGPAVAPVVTVDGPSGAGKGLLSATLARRTGWHLLDSGALYRLLGLCAAAEGVALDDDTALGALAARLAVRFVPGRDGIEIDPAGLPAGFPAGEPLLAELRSERAGRLASEIAARPAVRRALLALQRGYRRPPGLIADGRDMGTVVFPEAAVKFFLTASAEERARRRRRQLLGRGENVKISNLLRDIESRDRRDRERALSPLVPAAGAVRIDSTGRTPPAVAAEAWAALRARGLVSG